MEAGKRRVGAAAGIISEGETEGERMNVRMGEGQDNSQRLTGGGERGYEWVRGTELPPRRTLKTSADGSRSQRRKRREVERKTEHTLVEEKSLGEEDGSKGGIPALT